MLSSLALDVPFFFALDVVDPAVELGESKSEIEINVNSGQEIELGVFEGQLIELNVYMDQSVLIFVDKGLNKVKNPGPGQPEFELPIGGEL